MGSSQGNTLWGLVLALAITLVASACLVRREVPSEAQAITAGAINEVVVFGDGYSDAGTYNPTTGDDDPDNDVLAGMSFTTSPGSTWAVYVAEKLGLSLQSDRRVDFGIIGRGGGIATLGGTNYAEGGAHIRRPGGNGVRMEAVRGLGVVPVQDMTSRAISDQIDTYLNEHGGRFNERQLVLIQGGSNDLLELIYAADDGHASAAREHDLVLHIADAMAEEVLRLRSAGARHIVYANMPNLGGIPRFRYSAQAGRATRISQEYNDAVAAALKGSGVKIFDTAALMARIVASPASFGFSDTDSPACAGAKEGERPSMAALRCSMQSLVTPGADQYFLYADLGHPSSRAHEIWGARVIQMVLNAE